jgi:hypothetical protein
MWMNEHDVEDAVLRYSDTDTPNLLAGAQILARLVRWTNRNSDGWPYWSKPGNAAKRLMDVLRENEYAARFGHDRNGEPLTDITRADLQRALRPIKAFLTRQGVPHDAVLVEPPKPKRTYLRVVEEGTGEVVESLDITDESDRMRSLIRSGLRQQMNHGDFRLQQVEE